MIKITFTIILTGESKSITVAQSEVFTRSGRVYCPVWQGHFAELDLTRPDMGWLVYPD